MNRLVVLMLCLASAGGIAAYTHYSDDGAEPNSSAAAEPSKSRDRVGPTPVYTVPQRTPEPATAPPAPTVTTVIEPGDRVTLARALQRELKRVGCYSGEITGAWTTSSRMAMKAFTERVNATLPIDKPDHVLLSLVQGHRQRACGVACPAGQTATEGGACVPDAVLAKAGNPDGASDAPSDKGSAATPAAGAAAALALGGAATAQTERKALGERAAPRGGPVPPEGMRKQRPRRRSGQAAARPPKFVRDVLQILGFK